MGVQKRWMTCAAITLALGSAAPVQAQDFITIRDPDGTLAATRIDSFQALEAVQDAVYNGFTATGAPLPEILSVWTSFGLGGSRGGTYFIALENDVTNIGLGALHGGDGTLVSPHPPLKTILLHNSFRLIESGAQRHRAPVEGYGEYLFLLELSHLWGPALLAPGVFTGDDFIGFPAHWSFFMDSGGPAGGNVWVDNGDGTFTTATPTPGEVEFSMLDLYIMGMADASEVPPVGVLKDVQVPAGATDPIWRGDVQPRTFPWFDQEPLTVTATRVTYTMDEIVQKNGPRMPAFGDAPTSFTMAIVLVVPQFATDSQIEELEAEFAPLAAKMVPSFARATKNRGSLELVRAPAPDAGVEPDAGQTPDAGTMDSGSLDAGVMPADLGSSAPDMGSAEPEKEGCTCVTPSASERPFEGLAGLLLLWGLGGLTVVRRSARKPCEQRGLNQRSR